VIAKITPSFENGKGAIAINLTNGIGFGTTELHVIRPSSKVDMHFLYYLTISRDIRNIGAGMMQGTAGQKRVPDSFLINNPVTNPPLPEQQTIAAFLDRQTAKIDALIAKKNACSNCSLNSAPPLSVKPRRRDWVPRLTSIRITHQRQLDMPTKRGEGTATLFV
jgi:restriction endonuclease S subunit